MALTDTMANEKSTDSDDSLRDFLLDVLRYFVAHPQAKDTISGIGKWWLAKRMSPEERRKLEKSLDLLVAKGWLTGRCAPKSGTIYSVNVSRLEEIQQFLET
jgi:hypothetical protein